MQRQLRSTWEAKELESGAESWRTNPITDRRAACLTSREGRDSMYWYLEVLKKYAVFDGRARRREYWVFALVNLVIFFLLGWIEGILGIAPTTQYSVLATLFFLAVFLPSLAVSVRRLHDTGRSGWWVLIGLIPFIGWLVLFVFCVLDSQPGQNQYGPNPKEAVIM